MKVGRARFADAGLHGRFVLSDVTEMSFEDGTFDIVHSGGLLEFSQDIRRPIKEMVRVLKPGGVFAATMVPRKWSVQTVPDIERTALRTAKRLLTGRVLEAFQAVRGVPDEYEVNRARLGDYVKACQSAGLAPVTARGITPFPALTLPVAGRRLYGKMLRRLRPAWERFDRSRSWWTEWLGIGYRVYGVKPT